MRHALNPVCRYSLNVMRTVEREWNAFWYTPADPTLLGLLRILTGLMLVYTHAVWGLALDDFFGTTSWLSPSLVRAIESQQYTYSFWSWIPHQWMWPAYALSMVVFVCFTLGVWTRITSVLALFAAISYTSRVPAALFGLDQINIMLTLYLAIGPSGRCLSLDQWLSRRRLGSLAPLPAAERDGQRSPAANSSTHVRDLSLRGHLQAARAVVVEWRGDVAGVCQSGISVARHDLAGVAPLAGQHHVARVGGLGDRVLRVDLEAPVAADHAGRRGGAPRRDRRLPGDVDFRVDHAGRLCVVFAQQAVRGLVDRLVQRRATVRTTANDAMKKKAGAMSAALLGQRPPRP